MLESFGKPHARSNPYVTQLLASFPASVEAEHFSWRAALLGGYDVFHVHWPDARITGATRARTAVRTILYLVVIARIRLTGRALVRTLHNQEPHERMGAVRRWVLRASDRWTSLWIVMNDGDAAPGDAPVVHIPHGDYRDWFSAAPRSALVPGRLLLAGRLRGYKGVDALLGAFADLDGEVLLRFVGQPEDATVRGEIERACEKDERISALLEYVDDDRLAMEVTEAEVVVLPYDELTNSGALLLALSLDRPVLVPRADMTVALRREVGAGWVVTFDRPLTAEALERALAEVRAPRTAHAELSLRDWSSIGEAHGEAFRRALSRTITVRG